jgi:hypothetical protein
VFFLKKNRGAPKHPILGEGVPKHLVFHGGGGGGGEPHAPLFTTRTSPNTLAKCFAVHFVVFHKKGGMAKRSAMPPAPCLEERGEHTPDHGGLILV